MTKVEILYFNGCPNHHLAVQRVKDVLREENLSAEVLELQVNDADAAQRLHFLGSPSIRVNGLDVEPQARASQAFGLMCRTYGTACCYSGAPSSELICISLRQANIGAPSRYEE